jgi:hypothetical protein
VKQVLTSNVFKRLVGACLAAAVLGGCSATSTEQQAWLNHDKIDYLTPASSDDVRFAQVGEVVAIASQGRQQFQAKVTQRYFAASGRHCVQLQAVARIWVACEYSQSENSEQQRWGLSRSFNDATAQQGVQQ